ncbi:hypothetical protein L9F63_019081, partial [Diploptera punctata]
CVGVDVGFDWNEGCTELKVLVSLKLKPPIQRCKAVVVRLVVLRRFVRDCVWHPQGVQFKEKAEWEEVECMNSADHGAASLCLVTDKMNV